MRVVCAVALLTQNADMRTRTRTPVAPPSQELVEMEVRELLSFYK